MANPLLRLTRRAVGGAKRLKRQAKQRLGLFDPLQILPFRSYGTREYLVVSGRLLEREGVIYDADEAAAEEDATHSRNGRLDNLRASIRRFRSDEVPDARIAVRFGTAHQEVVTDEEGFFRLELPLTGPVEPGWKEVELELLESMAGSVGIRAKAHVFVPSDEAEFGIISDVDDTVIRTRATHRLEMVHTVLFNDARSRKPFPGVAAFYRALEEGPDARGLNPIFYVSRSGWNLYDLMDAFFEVQDVPHGPLFLTDISLIEPKSKALGEGQDKLTRIRKLLAAYPTLPFVLIGDSGQQDPEVYGTIVREHPGRIRAVYIRDVTSHRRDQEVRQQMEQLRALGVPALAVQDTCEAARHAAELGLIDRSALSRIEAASREDEAQPRREPEVSAQHG
ncbi:App1 family protein [Pyxidicoccus sp. 3LFB2]